ncbi:MAG: SGNH/GDSL hydrolase family protein [Bacteroidaceae bacterium]|nr:SGNH/GDSL hydrolase family protein [Bacteroidaceae bacterium]
MKSFFRAALLVSAMLLSLGLHAQQNNNDKKTWANYEKYAAANAALTTRPVAVFMGNSITENWARMHADFFTENNYVGRGISGQVTAQILARFQADVVALRPKVVAILAGTNDIAQNLQYIDLENIAQNIFSMCEMAKANKIKVILCSVLPCSIYQWRKELGDPSDKIVALNALLKDYAEKHKITYMDYHSAMKDEHNGLPKSLSNDGCHPTLDGYAIMEPMVMKAIKKLAK